MRPEIIVPHGDAAPPASSGVDSIEEGLLVEGRLVRIIGKLRSRGDQYSLVCEQVAEYSHNIEPSPQRKISDDNQKTSGQKLAKNNLPHRGKPPTEDRNNLAHQYRTVALSIKESSDAVEDAYLLREVVQILLEYPGKDRVNLLIQTGGRQVLMELPVISTGYTDEMKLRLEDLLGLDSVELQSGHIMAESSLPA